MHTLYQSMRMDLYYQELTCTVDLYATSKSSMKLNCFPIPSLYHRDIPKDRDTDGIRHELSMRKPYARCWSTIKDILQQSFMRARTMSDTCQARARKKILVSSLLSSGSNITIEKWRVITRLSKGGVREMSLSEWPFFHEGPTPCLGGRIK